MAGGTIIRLPDSGLARIRWGWRRGRIHMSMSEMIRRIRGIRVGCLVRDTLAFKRAVAYFGRLIRLRVLDTWAGIGWGKEIQ